MLKAMYVVLLIYLSLNEPLKMTVSMYHMICEINKYIDT